MATEVQSHREESVGSLATGIVNDFQDLLKQQLELTREELKAELRKSKEAAMFFSAGGVIGFVALFGVCLTLAHLMHWLAAPAGSDNATLPMWSCYAIVSCLFLLAGAGAIIAGKKKIDDIGAPLHETAQGLKENLEWKTNTNNRS